MSVNGKYKAQVIAMVSPETRLALIDAAKDREVSLSQHLRETLESSLMPRRVLVGGPDEAADLIASNGTVLMAKASPAATDDASAEVLADDSVDLRSYGKSLVAEPDGEPEPPSDGETAMDRMRRRGLI